MPVLQFVWSADLFPALGLARGCANQKAGL